VILSLEWAIRRKISAFRARRSLVPIGHARKCLSGSKSSQRLCGSNLNPTAELKVSRFGWTHAPGERVIQRVNNDNKPIFNGDGGAVAYHFGALDALAMAYATSVQESQDP
jgi:hypothetical protein